MNIFPEKETADSIISLIKQKMPLFESFEEVYLFGSILDSKNIAPTDIDLLLIYTKHSDNILRNVKEIRSTLEAQCGLPLDLTVLSVTEEQDVHFLDRLKSLYFKIK